MYFQITVRAADKNFTHPNVFKAVDLSVLGRTPLLNSLVSSDSKQFSISRKLEARDQSLVMSLRLALMDVRLSMALLTKAPPIGTPPSSKPSLACRIATSMFSRSLANGSSVGGVAVGPFSGGSIPENPVVWT